jgi:DNA polymerase-3 subunit gamma/tau
MSPALYRTYRPAAFSDIEGQGSHVSALARAIAAGEPHHAYLFTGPRGTGKTSTARLIAAGLNCDHGPTDSPCGTCPSCEAVGSQSSMDVVEIDAASHNSVDDIRELRNQVRVLPAMGRFRVFILDEAHMLSSSAWNALLKTLEEPPPQTVFVLCTTEAQKIPATVRSRCQHHAFMPATARQVADLLGKVAEREGFELADDAAHALARGARGSFRDGLSLLDAAAAHAHTGDGDRKVIDLNVARAVLRFADDALMLELLEAIASTDQTRTLTAAANLAATHDPTQALRDLEAFARDLLACAVYGRLPAALQTSPERDRLLKRLAEDLKASGVARLIDEIGQAMIAIRAGADPQLRLELCCLRAAAPSLRTGDEQLNRRLDKVEALALSAAKTRRPVN